MEVKAKIGMFVRDINGNEGKIIAMTEVFCIFEDEDMYEYSNYWENVLTTLTPPKKPTIK